MKKIALNKNWEYVEAALQNPLLVNMLKGWKKTDLPHDYSIEKGRDIASPAGLDEGFFQGAGLYYKKSFILREKADKKQIFLEFEGISGITEIWVNKAFIGKHRNPYTSCCFDVTDKLHVGENEIMLHTDSRMKPNSRWYVGAGLYREVSLYIGEKAAVKPYGLTVVTKEIRDDEAILSITAELTASADKVIYELVDAEGQIAASVENSEEMIVPKPLLWSVKHPDLYTLRVRVISGQTEDITEEKIGIRTISVSPDKGLLLNGEPLKLKGGCIHHDLGILGAADFEAAERRRIQILKESGFNAVRLAHNPFGPAIFKACDELGMLAVEEAFDEWVLGRTSFGLHITFEESWEKDVEDMILRDKNHPSILMWGTGNEVEERDGSADGFAWAKRLADKVKALDPSRPVTASACALFSEYGQRPADGTTGNQALNMAFDNFASGNDIWGDTTVPYFAPLDVAGYNYKSVRYAHDGKKFPNRVIYGSESYPRATFQTWKDTLANPNVIGDFVWTAWDYIGEVGVGRWEESEAPRPSDPKWPWMLASCSDIDLTGQKRPQSYYRDAVWNDDHSPHLFCLPPALTGKNIARLSWGWLPVERNYSFPGQEGKPLEVHIYANADNVELFQNGNSLGSKPCGEGEEYQAVFTVNYQSGSLTAVSYRDEQECGRDEIITAGATERLHLLADRSVIRADGRDLCFVTIKAVDANGLPVYNESGKVTVKVMGARLQGLGNADPMTDALYPFTTETCSLYHGMALAAIRSEEGGRGCMIEVTLEGREPVSLAIGFSPCESADTDLVSEAKPGAIDKTLGELLENPAARQVLENNYAQILQNPMLDSMKGMSLKKLLSMGGMEIPQAFCDALNKAFEEE